jgi:hypothetical protein
MDKKSRVQLSIINTYVSTASVSISRSLLESYLKTVEDKLWNDVWNLHVYLRLSHNHDPLSLNGTNEAQLMQNLYVGEDGQEYAIPNDCLGLVASLSFLRSIRGERSSNRKSHLLEKISGDIQIITNLENCVDAVKEEVVIEIKSLYNTLSQEIHTSGARFGPDIQFILPKIGGTFTRSIVYAIASIVNAIGFQPIYDTTDTSE